MNNLHVMQVKTSGREEFIDITPGINEYIRQAGITDGLCHIYVPHTTAGLTINEGADPSVAKDLLMQLNKLIPDNGAYTHLEGNSPAHIKSFLAGAEKTVPIVNGAMLLGTWQKVFFCEFDGPRQRKVFIKIIGD
ncbi:secondary thiamine-phosphate synthase enzyme YjbQ [Desulfoscipio geothermicus]|uniref:Secondary thiamine-phosphate synthase enzyme n=1 Tax=Desulfoscipio geothermicus DSM 3669 TaxID=1121426 RepID=A0A1I6DY85_9FIRM|nr:secondary thiamine-phosphate synthase enzyme YjbQ [Desulfoscipio geothermicus]SFR10248.1 secondary thiamine-phosphate synthase enzyme [Desulfoscipio geothermicus DSM 3669]